MKTIRLHGEMGRRFGRQFELDVATPAEAVRALCSQVRGFRAYLHANAHSSFKVFVGGRNAGGELGNLCSDKEVIRIAPVIQGAGAAGRIILGVVLIVAGMVANYIAPGNPISPYLFKMGTSMIIGGVIQMLSPVPQAPNMAGGGQAVSNTPSYNFDGPVNTVAQGHPVALAYGRLIVGSSVISAGLTT